MRKQILRFKNIKKTFVHKIILQKFTLKWIDPTYVLILTVEFFAIRISVRLSDGSKVTQN